jgi:hypothetical protein
MCVTEPPPPRRPLDYADPDKAFTPEPEGWERQRHRIDDWATAVLVVVIALVLLLVWLTA